MEHKHGLTCTEGTYASQSQVEEELLSFCKYYTMAVEKEQKEKYILQSRVYFLTKVKLLNVCLKVEHFSINKIQGQI